MSAIETPTDGNIIPLTLEQAAEILGRAQAPTPPARGIAALDVPAAEVEREIKLRMATELDRLQQRMPVTDGRLAEQRHWLDADPDTCLPLPGIAHKEEADRG